MTDARQDTGVDPALEDIVADADTGGRAAAHRHPRRGVVRAPGAKQRRAFFACGNVRRDRFIRAHQTLRNGQSRQPGQLFGQRGRIEQTRGGNQRAARVIVLAQHGNASRGFPTMQRRDDLRLDRFDLS